VIPSPYLYHNYTAVHRIRYGVQPLEGSLDGDDMYVDEPGNGELEGNMGESGAKNGDFEGDNEDEWK